METHLDMLKDKYPKLLADVHSIKVMRDVPGVSGLVCDIRYDKLRTVVADDLKGLKKKFQEIEDSL